LTCRYAAAGGIGACRSGRLDQFGTLRQRVGPGAGEYSVTAENSGGTCLF